MHPMRYSAKRDIAIAFHLSVRLSVTVVYLDYIGWKSWKLTARKISPTPSLFITQRPSTYGLLPGQHGEFFSGD